MGLPPTGAAAAAFADLQHTTSLDSHNQAFGQLGLPPLPPRSARDCAAADSMGIENSDATGGFRSQSG